MSAPPYAREAFLHIARADRTAPSLEAWGSRQGWAVADTQHAVAWLVGEGMVMRSGNGNEERLSAKPGAVWPPRGEGPPRHIDEVDEDEPDESEDEPAWLPKLEAYLKRQMRTRPELTVWQQEKCVPRAAFEAQLDAWVAAKRLVITGKAPRRQYHLDNAPTGRNAPRLVDEGSKGEEAPRTAARKASEPRAPKGKAPRTKTPKVAQAEEAAPPTAAPALARVLSAADLLAQVLELPVLEQAAFAAGWELVKPLVAEKRRLSEALGAVESKIEQARKVSIEASMPAPVQAPTVSTPTVAPVAPTASPGATLVDQVWSAIAEGEVVYARTVAERTNLTPAQVAPCLARLAVQQKLKRLERGQYQRPVASKRKGGG